MAKVADEYFKVHPWKVVEEGFDPSRNAVSESIFSLGNEYMGVRGYFEEGSTCEDQLLGSYFNGVYENAREETPAAYKSVVKRSHFMVNAVDWLYTRISIDGEKLDMNTAKLTGFVRTLDLKTGILTREFTVTTGTGKKVKFEFERLLNMENSVEGYQKISAEAVDCSAKLELTFGLDFNIVHGKKYCFWDEAKKGVEGDVYGIIGSTLTTGQRIFSGYTLKIDGSAEVAVKESDKFIGCDTVAELAAGKPVVFTKSVTNIVEKDPSVDTEDLWTKGVKATAAQEKDGYEKTLEADKKFWDNVWENFDVEIEGDNTEKDQQGVRFCIFQLQQTYHGQDPRNNIGAKGLTGEAYSGHAFWDTETCCLPVYLFSNPKAAKNLLEFRYSTLPNAMARANDLDCKGACYPIATLNGNEACSLWQHASTQFQPSTGVAFGIWHYEKVTGDKEFLYGHGIEMIVQICRFLASRGQFAQKTGRFGYYGVMGPDEFQVMVNHNCYTNLMAKLTFEYAIEVLKEMKEKAPDKYDELVKKVGSLDEDEKLWQVCIDKMYIPYDEKTKIFEQHDGFFDLPHIDIHSIPVTDFPLYSHWAYDRIYRNDMIKQPDVLQFIFMHNSMFTMEQKKANYEFYEPKTIHESSLSPSIHSVLAAELDKHEEALNFFGFATRMDLDNYNRNTCEGLHTTSIAAAWVNIVYGFGGMRSDADKLTFNPSIPKTWKKYSFRLVYKDAILVVTVSDKDVEFKVTNNKSLDIRVYGKDITVDGNGVKIALPANKRG